MNKFTIVLVRPRDPNNIGAAARAMANFGLSELRVVEPYLPTWQIAVSAVGAQDILQNAKLFSSLPQALADCHLSIATTALKTVNSMSKLWPCRSFLLGYKTIMQKKLRWYLVMKKQGFLMRI